MIHRYRQFVYVKVAVLGLIILLGVELPPIIVCLTLLGLACNGIALALLDRSNQ